MAVWKSFIGISPLRIYLALFVQTETFLYNYNLKCFMLNEQHTQPTFTLSLFPSFLFFNKVWSTSKAPELACRLHFVGNVHMSRIFQIFSVKLIGPVGPFITTSNGLFHTHKKCRDSETAPVLESGLD